MCSKENFPAKKASAGLRQISLNLSRLIISRLSSKALLLFFPVVADSCPSGLNEHLCRAHAIAPGSSAPCSIQHGFPTWACASPSNPTEYNVLRFVMCRFALLSFTSSASHPYRHRSGQMHLPHSSRLVVIFSSLVDPFPAPRSTSSITHGALHRFAPRTARPRRYARC